MVKRELLQIIVLALLTGLAGGCTRNVNVLPNATAKIVKVEEISSVESLYSEDEISTEDIAELEDNTYCIIPETESEEDESEIEQYWGNSSSEEISFEDANEDTTKEIITEVPTQISSIVENTYENETSISHTVLEIETKKESETLASIVSQIEHSSMVSTEMQTEPTTVVPQTEPATVAPTVPQTEQETVAPTVPYTEPPTTATTIAQTETQTEPVMQSETIISPENENQISEYDYYDLQCADVIKAKFIATTGYQPSWSPEYKIIRIFEFVCDYLTYDNTVSLELSKVIESGRGNCSAYARLEVLLLRSCNVDGVTAVSWSRNHAYVGIRINGEELIFNSTGNKLMYLDGVYLVIGRHYPELYRNDFEPIYGPMEDENVICFESEDEKYEFAKKYAYYIVRSRAYEENIPVDTVVSDYDKVVFPLSERQIEYDHIDVPSIYENL